jgi:hypothetical protein
MMMVAMKQFSGSAALFPNPQFPVALRIKAIEVL